jgi:hypothetical protein
VWAVRPEGALGAAGWIEGKPWVIKYVRASSKQNAIEKSTKGD